MHKRWIALGTGIAGGMLVVQRRRRPDLAGYFRDKACVVTGGGSGFGLETVQQLHQMGARVLVVDLDESRLATLHEQLPAVQTLALDLTATDAPQQVLDMALAHLGRIDLLYNNAGVAAAGTFLVNTPAQVQRMIDVNFTAHIRLTHCLLPQMIADGGGDIAYTASLAAWVSAPTLAVYSGTKGGIKQFAHALRREVSGQNIRIICLHPNVVRTNLMPGHVFDLVDMKYGVPETITALLHGIAAGKRDIFVNRDDRVLQRLEQFAPWLIDSYLSRRNDAQALMDYAESTDVASRRAVSDEV